MTDLTDDQRREVRNTARVILDLPYNHSVQACELASFVLDNVDAPERELSEELSNIAEHWEEWTTNTITAKLNAATGCAKQMEHDLAEARAEVTDITEVNHEIRRERDEARAEVERLDAVAEDYARRATAALTERDEAQSKFAEVMNARDSLRGDYNHARDEIDRLTVDLDEAYKTRDARDDEVDRLRAEVERLTAVNENLRRTYNYREFKEFLGVQKGAESNAETPDPADVPPGEAWLVECRGERRTAVKDRADDAPWSTIDANGRHVYKRNENVALITRLVPAPHVITNPDELEALPHRTVIRDADLSVGEKSGKYWDITGSCCDASSDCFVLPVTVLWEPEA